MKKVTKQKSISFPFIIEDAIQTIRIHESGDIKILGYNQTIIMLIKEALKARGHRV